MKTAEQPLSLAFYCFVAPDAGDAYVSGPMNEVEVAQFVRDLHAAPTPVNFWVMRGQPVPLTANSKHLVIDGQLVALPPESSEPADDAPEFGSRAGTWKLAELPAEDAESPEAFETIDEESQAEVLSMLEIAAPDDRSSD